MCVCVRLGKKFYVSTISYMFFTLQRLITQSKRVFLRETIPTSNSEIDSVNQTVEANSNQVEIAQFLPEELKLAKSEVVPFLVRRNLEQKKSIRITNTDVPLTKEETVGVTGSDAWGHEQDSTTTNDSYDDS